MGIRLLHAFVYMDGVSAAAAEMVDRISQLAASARSAFKVGHYCIVVAARASRQIARRLWPSLGWKRGGRSVTLS